jgi:hypothetical protein
VAQLNWVFEPFVPLFSGQEGLKSALSLPQKMCHMLKGNMAIEGFSGKQVTVNIRLPRKSWIDQQERSRYKVA